MFILYQENCERVGAFMFDHEASSNPKERQGMEDSKRGYCLPKQLNRLKRDGDGGGVMM